ncbi:MAG: histidine kinase [Rhodospirillaceae bacterium BRH_c57]|nr:MAG: histidine kinase [Rhodospirillaceae bacterium BRH_c57]
MASKKASSPVWDMRHLRAAIDASGVALWSWNVDTDEIVMDECAHRLWGVLEGEDVTFEDLSARIHPEDIDRVRAAFAATRAVLGPYETDFRVVVGNEVRWISARGQGSDVGMHERSVFGIFLDVTQRKQAEEASELLSGEMSHRVRNLLQVASSLTLITSRSAATAEDLVRDITNRLSALGRAHALVRPVPGQTITAVLLGDILTVLLAPYENMADFSERIRVSVPKMGIGEAATTTLALVVHELATNSLKYGALSTENGTIDVSCGPVDDHEMAIVWMERGGPTVAPPTEHAGFGSKMIVQSVSRTLGGSIDFDWSPEGLIATLRVNTDRLTK